MSPAPVGVPEMRPEQAETEEMTSPEGSPVAVQVTGSPDVSSAPIQYAWCDPVVRCAVGSGTPLLTLSVPEA